MTSRRYPMVEGQNFFKHIFLKSDGILIFFIALLTALASEIKVVPFNGEAFRFGLGSIAFFWLLLVWTPRSLVRTGFVTGMTVVCFRLLGDLFFGEIGVLTSLSIHLPAFLYYFLFACGFYLIKFETYKTMPLLLGGWATLFEFIGNGAEHITRYWLFHSSSLELREWALLLGVALLRSYFVVGLYSSITLTEQKKRMQKMLEVGSDLYGETLYLQKSMNHIEKITASSFDLSRILQKEGLQRESKQALRIAQEIHEVKKDSQRILAGLLKVTRKRGVQLYLEELLDLVVVSNKKYSELLKKKIEFRVDVTIDFETDRHIPLLAILNNLVANSVEAIKDKGEIELAVFEQNGQLHFLVKDSEKGLSKEDVALIFEPGYTTKFNDNGVAATGIGLSHVQEIVRSINGQIRVDVEESWTVFEVIISEDYIKKGW